MKKQSAPETHRPTVNDRARAFAFGGGVVGLVTFLAVGLLPSLVYGGFAGATLAAALLGHPVDGGLFARAIVVFGMVTGLLATAGVFVVGGAALGSLLHGLARVGLPEHADAEAVTAKTAR